MDSPSSSVPSSPIPPASPPSQSPPVSSPSPSPVTTTPLSPPPPSPIINQKSSIFHHPSSIIHLAPFLLIILILSTFALSYFFFSRQPQPKTAGRASYSISPTSPFSISPSLSPQITNNQLTITASPATISSSFASIKATSVPSPSIIQQPTSAVDHPPRIAFDLIANENIFTPNQLTAYQAQIIAINITAVDKTYDFSLPGLGLSQTIPKGERKTLEFQATSFGQYIFSCDKNCAGSFTARGLLIIKP